MFAVLVFGIITGFFNARMDRAGRLQMTSEGVFIYSIIPDYTPFKKYVNVNFPDISTSVETQNCQKDAKKQSETVMQSFHCITHCCILKG